MDDEVEEEEDVELEPYLNNPTDFGMANFSVLCCPSVEVPDTCSSEWSTGALLCSPCSLMLLLYLERARSDE